MTTCPSMLATVELHDRPAWNLPEVVDQARNGELQVDCALGLLAGQSTFLGSGDIWSPK